MCVGERAREVAVRRRRRELLPASRIGDHRVVTGFELDKEVKVIRLDRKALKEATRVGGQLGQPLRIPLGPLRLVHHIGDDWQWHGGQGVFLVEYQEHLGLTAMLSRLKIQVIAIPKGDVVHWGVLERREVPIESRHATAGDRLAYLLTDGVIGALSADSLNARFEKEQGGQPVIAVTYQADGEEHAFFLSCPGASEFRKAHALLDACLPGLLRG